MKYYGNIGFATEVTEHGVTTTIPIEKAYRGNINRFSKQGLSEGVINTGVNITNEISIVADAFAVENIYKMLYIWISGQRWKINTVTIDRPRLTLSIGGLYNGPTI